MKKRMELQITMTFVIMFIVGVIIFGIHSIIQDSNFLNFEVMTEASLSALIYLIYIWIYTRKHQILASIGFLSVFLTVVFAYVAATGETGILSWNWYDVIMILYFVVASSIAKYQGKKL